MILEICANSYQSAKNAQEAGAHRIELCQELAVGGITPSYGLLRQVLKNLTIPVFILIRPRSGNFNYSESEFQIMKQNIELCKDLGCNGIVSGVLNADDTIDVDRTKQLMEIAKPLSFTFHRAFDFVPEPLIALKQLIELGVDRVLTSGQKTSVELGFDLLMKMHDKAKGQIIVMPGGGLDSQNVSRFKDFGFKEIHSSAKSKETQSKERRKNKFEQFDPANFISNSIEIQKILAKIS